LSGVLERHDGAHLPYAVHPGRGPRLLFAHGLMARGLDGDAAIAPLLDRGWAVAVHDQRGHGQASPVRDAAEFRPDVLAADMLALLDRLGWRRAWLGGGSMGAAVALAAAAMAPQRVEGLVLMAPAVGAQPNPALGVFAKLGAAFASGGDDAGARGYAELCRRAGMGEDAIAAKIAPLRLQPAASWAAVLRAFAAWSLDGALRQASAVHAPVLVMAWPNDPVHPVAAAREYAAALRGAMLRLIAPPADPADLFRTMLQMLAETHGPPAGGDRRSVEA
jgi:pimeloyl-ACP methyl ester carboxylesterase